MLLWLLACQTTPEPYALVVPEGFPEPPIPAHNPLTEPGVELGRRLFYDTRLSDNQTQSCSTCHLQELAFTDGLTTGLGSTGQVHPRNANGLSNVAYNATLTWANPNLVELETQLLVPLFGDAPVELGAGRGADRTGRDRHRRAAAAAVGLRQRNRARRAAGSARRLRPSGQTTID